MSDDDTKIEPFETEVDALRAAFNKWYNGSRRESEKELALYLGSSKDLAEKLTAGTAKDRKSFGDLLVLRGIKFQSNTSLIRKVLLASGCKDSLIDGYVRVIAKAMKQMQPGETMLQYFDRKGGVDAIRRSDSNGVSKADQVKSHRTLAIQDLNASTGIGTPFRPPSAIRPKDDSDYNYAVALVRFQADGKAIIAGGTNDQTLVGTALATIGKSIDAEIEAKAIENAREAALAERNRKLGIDSQEADADDDQTATTATAGETV